MKVGRNDPCPCGSGKKYKKCCLARRQTRRKLGQIGVALDRSMEWLDAEHPEVVHFNMFGGFFGVLGEGDVEALDSLPPDLQVMVHQNFREWLLAEGLTEAEEGEAPRRVLDLVLEESGLAFDPDIRGQLEELGRRRMSLYEVDEAVPGEGVRVHDLLAPEATPCWVHERTASRDLSRWDIIGARLIPVEDEEWIFSGAMYPVPRHRAHELRDEMVAQLEEAEPGTALEHTVRTFTILDFWFGMLLASREVPTLVDSSSGDPLEFVTDHYEVRDWEALEAALAACADVEGNRERGWARLEKSGDDARRPILAVNPREGDRLEVFARTRRRADEGRSWLAEVAGRAVRFVDREVVDPRTEALAAGDADAEEGDDVPMTTELMQQVLEHVYRDWADKPLPALDGETPRQAIRTAKGRDRVVELLKTYEHSEARRARAEDREVASLRFLWEELGLDREELLG